MGSKTCMQSPLTTPKAYVAAIIDMSSLHVLLRGPPEQSCCVACPSVDCCCLQGCLAQVPANCWPGVPQISSQG